MKKINNVSDQEIVNSLKESIKKNDSALSYISSEKNRYGDLLKYNDNDIISQDIYENLSYCEFTLNFLGNQYREALSLRGVKIS